MVEYPPKILASEGKANHHHHHDIESFVQTQ